MSWSPAADLRPSRIALLALAAALLIGVGAANSPRRTVEAVLALALVALVARSLLFGVVFFVVAFVSSATVPFVVNKALFTKAGLDPSKPPTTWAASAGSVPPSPAACSSG